MNNKISTDKNIGGAMNKILLAAAMVLGFGARTMADTCLTCIFNQQSLQVGAQFHVSSGTVDGPFTVGSLIAAALNINSITASSFNGSGASLTNLNASSLGSGTVPSARVTGTYSGLTGVGTLTAGVWNASILAAQYGGTGANLGSAPSGALPYFSGTGTMSALAAGTATYLLQSNGSSAPSYTHAPSVLGTNVTAIPMANLITGALPLGIAVADANLSVVSASKVQGDIPGNAANINGTLAIGQLGAGTLSTNNPASSVTASGVTPGIYGGPNLLPQLTVGSDGRITNISQSGLTIGAADLQPGLLPSGVTINPSQINSGSLGGGVIASSLNATGVSPASYGFASSVPSLTVRADGRLSAASQTPIAINTNQINNGTLTAGVVVPAVNVQAGSLAANVIASSIAANGVAAGIYGGHDNTVAITIGADGRITSATTYAVPGLSTNAVQNNIDNAWAATQTFFDSVTVHANLSATNIVATTLAGDGSAIFNLNPALINGGILGPAVIASSVAASGVAAGAYGSGTQVPTYTVGVDGRITAAANVTITGVPAATVPASGVLPGTLGANVIATNYSGGAVPNVTTFASSLTANSSLYVRGAGAIGLSPAPMGTPPAIFAFGGGLAVADNNSSDHFLMEIGTSPTANYGLAYSTQGVLSVKGIDPTGIIASFGDPAETVGSNIIVVRANYQDASAIAFSTNATSGPDGSNNGAFISYQQDSGDYRITMAPGVNSGAGFNTHKMIDFDVTAGKAEVRNAPLEVLSSSVTAAYFATTGGGFIIENGFDEYLGGSLLAGSNITATKTVKGTTVTATSEFSFPNGEAILLTSPTAQSPYTGPLTGLLAQGAVLDAGQALQAFPAVLALGDVTTGGIANNSGMDAAYGIYGNAPGKRGVISVNGGIVTGSQGDSTNSGINQSANAASVQINGGNADGNGSNIMLIAGPGGGSQFGSSGNIQLNPGDNLGAESVSAVAITTQTTVGGETLTLAINGEAPQTITLGAHSNDGPGIAADIQAQVRALTPADAPDNGYAYTGFVAKWNPRNSGFYDLLVPCDVINFLLGNLQVTGGSFAPLARLGVAQGGGEHSGSIGVFDVSLGFGIVPGALDAMNVTTQGTGLQFENGPIALNITQIPGTISNNDSNIRFDNSQVGGQNWQIGSSGNNLRFFHETTGMQPINVDASDNIVLAGTNVNLNSGGVLAVNQFQVPGNNGGVSLQSDGNGSGNVYLSTNTGFGTYSTSDGLLDNDGVNHGDLTTQGTNILIPQTAGYPGSFFWGEFDVPSSQFYEMVRVSTESFQYYGGVGIGADVFHIGPTGNTYINDGLFVVGSSTFGYVYEGNVEAGFVDMAAMRVAGSINTDGAKILSDGSGNLQVKGTLAVGVTPVIWYYCSGSAGGLQDGGLSRGTGSTAAGSNCIGGSWVATSMSSQ